MSPLAILNRQPPGIIDTTECKLRPPACNHRRRHDGDCNYSRHELRRRCTKDDHGSLRWRLDAYSSRDLLVSMSPTPSRAACRTRASSPGVAGNRPYEEDRPYKWHVWKGGPTM